MSEILAGPDETSPPGASAAAGAAGIGPRAKQWLIYAGIGVALIIVGAILAETVPVGGGGGGGSNETVPDVAPAPVATTSVSDTTPTSAPLDTTPAETAPSAAVAPPIEPIGDAISADELELGADAIGPLALGSDGAEAVGRLVAGFGQPTSDSGVVVASPDLGVCSGQMRTVRWGALTLVNSVGETGEETLVAFRIDAAQASGDADPTASLRTLSGLGLGDTVADLKVIYAGFQVDLTEREGAPAFELYSSADDFLIWGSITAADDSGTVTGIRSPATCNP
jgi:hypothetical protein